MYPIIIKRVPQEVNFQKEVELEESLMTLSKLRKYVSEDETFSISEVDSRFGVKTMLYVYGRRFETQEEVDKRVSKEELYMKKYNEYHSHLNDKDNEN